MPKVLWYYIVAAIGFILVVYTFIRKKPFIDLLSFFLASASLCYLLEVVALFVLRSYDYKPGLFPDPIAEDIFGHLICNGLFWGGFIMLVSAFSLRFYWVLLIAVFFMLVEEFFVKMDLYVHFWWRTGYTGIGAFIILMILKNWYAALRDGFAAFRRFIAFFLTAWLLLVGPSIVLLDAGKQHFGTGLSYNYYLDDIFFEVPLYLLLSLASALAVVIAKKALPKALPFLLIPAADILLSQAGILTFSGGWSLFYLLQCRILGLLGFTVLERRSLLLRPEASHDDISQEV